MSATLNIPAFVAASRRRPALIEPHLAGQPHVMYYGSDTSTLPPGMRLQRPWAKLNSLGHYRAYCNHREMAQIMLKANHQVALFFEDDAVPNCPDWVDTVNYFVQAMRSFDVLFLHGRELQMDKWNEQKVRTLHTDKSIFTPKEAQPHCIGSLAYLITDAAAEYLARNPFFGVPIDHVLPNLPRFGVMLPSPFNHDRSQGSMVQGSLKSERRIGQGRITGRNNVVH